MSWLDSKFNQGPPGTPGTNGTNGQPGLGLSQSLNWVALTADGWTTIYTVAPALLANEAIDVYAVIRMGKATAVAGATGRWQRSLLDMQNVGGTVQDANGNSADQDDRTPQVGSVIVGAAARILVSGTSILVQAQRPTGFAGLFASAVVDYTRGVPAAHSAVIAVSPASLAPSVGSPVLMTITLNFGATGATQASIGGTLLTSLTVLNDTTITGFLPSGTYSVGTYNVNVTAPASPTSLIAGFAFSAVVTGISPASDYAYGGTAVTITGSGFTGATSAALAGVNVTSFVVVDDGHITGVSGSTTDPTKVGVHDVTVVNGPTGTGAGLWTYNHDPLTILGATNVFLWLEPRVCAQSGGFVTGVTDLSGHSNTPSTITAVAYSASDASYGSTPSWSFNGTTSIMDWASAINPSTQAFFRWAVMDMKSTATAAWFADTSLSWEIHENGSMQALINGVAAVWGTNTGVLNTPTTIACWGQSGGGSNATSNIAVANGTPVLTTGGGAGSPYPANQPFAFGARSGVSIPMNFSCASFLLASIQPSPTQLTQLQTYAHSRFGV